MHILVTGGAGYIGSILVNELLKNGHKVKVYDSLRFGGNSLLPMFQYPHFSFVKGDIRDTALLEEHVKNTDAIIHLAAIVGYPACKKYPDLAKSVNVDATIALMKMLSKDQLVLYASTGSNYGAVPNGICTEETPLSPVSLYGETKTQAEQVILQHQNSVAYRFATAFGLSPRMRLDLLINDFVYKALTQKYIVVYESHFMRTFIHVRDIVRAFSFALENISRMKGQTYNVGHESMNYTKKEICEMIARKIEYYLHLADIGNDEDKRNYRVSYQKIAAHGFQVSVSMEQGIDELVRGIQALEIKEPYANL